MTFLEGFAQGFTTERTRSLEKKEREDARKFEADERTKNLKLQYAFDDIKARREERKTLADKQKETVTSAKELATLLGAPDDPNVVTEISRKLTAGDTYASIKSDILDKRMIKDPNYKPTVSLKVKTPAGVQRTTYDYLEGYDDETRKTVTEIAPNLAKPDVVETPVEIQAQGSWANEGSSNSPITYTDKPKDFKMPGMAEALYDLDRLKKENASPEKITEAKMVVDAIERASIFNAKERAKAEGKELKTYARIDKRGRVVNTYAGEYKDGKFMNLANPAGPQEVPETDGMRIVEFNEDQFKQYNNVVEKVAPDVSKYEAGMASYNAAMKNAGSLYQILKDPELSQYTTTIGGAASALNKLGEEFQNFTFMFSEEKGSGGVADFKSALESGDDDRARAIMYETEETIKTLEEKVNSILPEDRIKRAAATYALAESYKIAAAYQFAAAQGVATGKMSNQDFENNYTQLSANRGPDAIMRALKEVSTTAFIRLKSQRDAIENNPLVRNFKILSNGIVPDVSPERVEDSMIKRSKEEGYHDFWLFANNKMSSPDLVRSKPSQTEEPQTKSFTINVGGKPTVGNYTDDQMKAMARSNPEKFKQAFGEDVYRQYKEER